MSDEQREYLGRVVRAAWMAWARQQPHVKASWMVSWEQLLEPEREVDRQIGEAIWQCAGTYHDLLMFGRPTEDDPYRASRLAWEDVLAMAPETWLPEQKRYEGAGQ